MTAALALLLCCASPAAAAEPFDSFRDAAAWVETTRGGVRGGRVTPHWIDGGPAFRYRPTTGPDAGRLVVVDPASGTRRPVIDAEGSEAASGVERLIRTRPSGPSAAETRVTFRNDTDRPARLFWVDRSRRLHSYGVVPPGDERRQHTFAGHVWLVRDPDGAPLAAFAATEADGLAVIDGTGPVPTERRRRERDPAAKGSARAWLANGDLWARVDGEPRRLTDAAAEPVPAGYDRVEYRGPALVAPGGRTVSAVRVAVFRPAELTLSDPGPTGTARPTLIRLPYPKPGEPMDRPAPALFDAATGEPIPVSPAAFDKPFALSRWRWAADGSELFFLHNPRGHRYLQLLAADAATGAVRVVIDERPGTFVDYSRKTELHWLDDGSILWASERSGWNHLYRIDPATGDVLNPVTAGEWVVRGVEKIAAGRVWFTAGGVVPGQDPYHAHLCRAPLPGRNGDGTGFAVLTSDAAESGDGTHDWTFSPDGDFLLDRFSRVDLPPVTVLRNAETGAFVLELERADAADRLATGWRPPVRFAAPGRDGATMIHGFVIFPPGFDPEAAEPGSLPVIEQIYAGPHDAHVPKAWGRQPAARELAALGFAVVRCDGMGTNWRSKAFHDVCWRNLKDAGFPDRIAFLRAAAERWPALDLSRVGVFGGSAGGQNALRALLSHGDFYRAAAADCGCHDNRVDKRWWNEAWMGLPADGDGTHYAASSNARDAHRLTGDLLLTVGGLDRNVDPASTMQVVDALIDADKDFDLIVFPRRGHGVGESEYGRRRRAEFFQRTLASPNEP